MNGLNITSTISAKRLTSIPKQVAEALGLKEGNKLAYIKDKNGRIYIEKQKELNEEWQQ